MYGLERARKGGCLARAALLLGLLSGFPLTGSGAGLNEGLQQRYDLRLPAGQGPHPVVVAVSGCSGFDAAETAYRHTLDTLRDEGFATIRVDYVGASEHPRCRQGGKVLISRDEVVAGIRQAVSHLGQQARIKASAINLLGWSYGGGSVLHYLATPLSAGSAGANDPDSVSAVVAYYPSCHGVSMWRRPVPVLVLFGGADTVAPPKRCKALFSGAAAALIEMEEYANAYHAFDMIHLPAKMEYRFGIIGHEPTAAKQSLERLVGFLRR